MDYTPKIMQTKDYIILNNKTLAISPFKSDPRQEYPRA